ncbi:hypothetical protein [Shewanella surugensis]|nr:hypothetical protein [Shewanella surugensis]
METIENGLRGIEPNSVNGLMLIMMMIIFILGLWFTHKNKHSAFV